VKNVGEENPFKDCLSKVNNQFTSMHNDQLQIMQNISLQLYECLGMQCKILFEPI
jgi:hypothetical protein